MELYHLVFSSIHYQNNYVEGHVWNSDSIQFDRDDATFALLEYFVAFDTVNHGILFPKLSDSFGVGDAKVQGPASTVNVWDRLQQGC